MILQRVNLLISLHGYYVSVLVYLVYLLLVLWHLSDSASIVLFMLICMYAYLHVYLGPFFLVRPCHYQLAAKVC